MTAMPFFSINVGAWIVATAGMRLDEIGAFDSLLMVMSASPDQALPDDNARLARYARCTPERWAILRVVLAPHFIVRDGSWRHEWIEKEVAFIAEKKAKRKFAADTRWHGKSAKNKESGHAHASSVHMQNDATFTSLSLSQEKKEKTPSDEGVSKKARRRPEVGFPESDLAFEAECAQIAAERQPDLDFATIFDRFKNHAASVDRRCRDWRAAFRVWLSKEDSRHGTQHRHDRPGGHRAGNALAALAEMGGDDPDLDDK